MLSSLRTFLKKNRFVAYGLPFMVMLVGGSFGLKQFAQLRYTYRSRESFTIEEAKKHGLPVVEERPSVENVYEKIKETNIDTWENIRGPRPWEDSKVIQTELRTKQDAA